MKKSLIALAVAGAMVAPMVAQADATLYGSMRIELNSADGADLDLNDNSSRVGIKGDVDLGLENTKGVFHWEFNINTTDDGAYGDLGERLAYIGATGNWGTALVGRQYHPHYLMMNLNTYTFSDASMAERYFLGNDNHKRVSNTLAYVSPSFNGFTIAAGTVIAGAGTDADGTADSDSDGYNVAAQYKGNGLSAAISFASVNDDVPAIGGIAGASGEDDDVWGLSVKYAVTDAATIMVRYEDSEEDGANNDEEVTFIGGTYKIDNTTLKLAYTDLEAEVAADEEDAIMLEVQQKLGKGSVYAAYMDVDAETAANDTDLFTIGYRLDF
ncbi:MAG: porin [Neptuniibacter sp.]